MKITIDELLKHPLSFVSDEAAAEREPFISTRIRLSRNLAGFPFPTAATPESAREVCAKVEEAVRETKLFGDDFYAFEPEELSHLDRRVLMERRLASQELISHPEETRIFSSTNESASVMVNEEDQLRLQVYRPGGQLDAVWQEISRLDDLLATCLDYAYDSKLGFLTACPTNVGTGIRASVMLHLPALMITDQIAGTVRGINKLGLAVRGIFGEGTDNRGNLYQISNQSTLGESETQIIANLKTVLYQVIEQEQQARENLLNRDRHALLDHIGRSYGVLKYSYKLGADEAHNCLSSLRLGVDLGLFHSVTLRQLTELGTICSSGHLQKRAGGELAAEECDVQRARFCREMLK